ncbi:MAG: cell division protein ZapA [Mediterranea sp.]|jgi:cell division protein ZapA|nr:cell division protein ZapA [Mediterranea sp.]
MDDKIKINLKIAEANYPLTISRDEEEIVREAAKRVDIRLNAYRAHYPSLNLEKVIAMVAYEFSLETLKQKQRNDTAPYTEKIEELTGILEDYFKSNALQ